MAKPQPAYTKLNPTPRSMKNHGQYRRTGKAAHGSPVVRTDHSAGRATVADLVTWSIITGDKPKPPTIPYAGVRAGELIGHRLWLVIKADGLRLCSLAHKRIWKSSRMDGNLEECVCQTIWEEIWGGVYAFDTKDRLMANVANEWDMISKMEFPRPWRFESIFENPEMLYGAASGEVSAWGEVIEHEHGFRAQHVRIKSLDYVFGEYDIEELRSRYLIGN